MQKFETLRQPLLGELAMSWREEARRKKEKKMPFIVATYVYASSQGQRTHSARTKIVIKGARSLFWVKWVSIRSVFSFDWVIIRVIIMTLPRSLFIFRAVVTLHNSNWSYSDN